MARRPTTSKKKGKKTAPRKKKISGVGSNDVTSTLAVIAGAVGTRVINNMVQKQWPGTNIMLVAAGAGAVGWFLPKFVRNPLMKPLGMGMLAMAGTQIMVSTGIIAGIGGTGDRMRYRISGGNLSNLNTLSGGIGSGVSTLNTVSGGYRRVAGVQNEAISQSAVYDKPSMTEVLRRKINLKQAS